MPTTRVAARRGAALLLAAVLAACVGERERLIAPDVKVYLDERQVAPGGEVTGRIVATDGGGGIVAVSIRAVTGDSTSTDRWDLIASDSADFGFALHVPVNAADGTPIVITGGTINDQLLSDVIVDTAFVRRAP